MKFSFERLEVYQRAVKLANEVYMLTKKFPKQEVFGLTAQLRRASVSVPLNIAEGSSLSKKQFCHFLDMARGSVYECVPLLQIILEQNFIGSNDYTYFYEEYNKIAMMISALKNSLDNSVNSEQSAVNLEC